MTRQKLERCKRALERRRANVHHWRLMSVQSNTPHEREQYDRKLFIAEKDVRHLEEKVSP